MTYELMKIKDGTARVLARADSREELFKIAMDRGLCEVERYGITLKSHFEIMSAVVSKEAA